MARHRLRLLGLTFLLLAMLACAVAEDSPDDEEEDEPDYHYSYDGHDYITDDYLLTINYYREKIHWYIYKKPIYSSRYLIFDFLQPNYYKNGRPGYYFYHYPRSFSGFSEGAYYYAYYYFPRSGKKYYFKFRYSEKRFSPRNSRPYTLTAYGRRGKYYYYDDSHGTKALTPDEHNF